MRMHIKSSWKIIELYCLTSLLLLMAAPAECKAQEKPERDSIIAAAREIIGMQKYCALITVDSSGKPQVRTMNPFPPEDDMTV